MNPSAACERFAQVDTRTPMTIFLPGGRRCVTWSAIGAGWSLGSMYGRWPAYWPLTHTHASATTAGAYSLTVLPLAEWGTLMSNAYHKSPRYGTPSLLKQPGTCR